MNILPFPPALPGPGERIDLDRGLSVRKNQRNPFYVVTLRYEADPDKDPLTERGKAWCLTEMKDMGCSRVCRECDEIYAVEIELCPKCQAEPELIYSNKWKREYEIDYSAQSGSYVFDTFSKARNVCQPFRIPAQWRRFRVVDYGLRNPTVCLWIAVDPDRNAWVYREHYEANQTIEHHAAAIHRTSAYIDHHALGLTESDLRMLEADDWSAGTEYTKACARIYNTLGDPSMGNTTQKEIKTVRHRFADHGVFIRQANRARAGIETLNSMFSLGTITVFDCCPNTIREVSNWTWSEHNDPGRNKKERPVDRDDHCCDCLIYFANEFAPPSPEAAMEILRPATAEQAFVADRENFQRAAGGAGRYFRDFQDY